MLTVNKPAEGALHSKYLKANQSTTVSLSRSAFLAHTNSLLPLKLAKLEVNCSALGRQFFNMVSFCLSNQ